MRATSTRCDPNFNAALNFRHVTKWSEQVTVADATVEAMRRAFTPVKNGRPGPVLVEFPTDILREEIERWSSNTSRRRG